MIKLPFYRTCVNWDPDELHVLDHLVEHEEKINLSTFRRHVDPVDFARIQRLLGYGPWLKLKNDYHVRYHKSGSVVYMVHSAIEHVFATNEQIKKLSEAIQTSEDSVEETLSDGKPC